MYLPRRLVNRYFVISKIEELFGKNFYRLVVLQFDWHVRQDASSSSAGIDRGITGSIWRKLSANKIIPPPNGF